METAVSATWVRNVAGGGDPGNLGDVILADPGSGADVIFADRCMPGEACFQHPSRAAQAGSDVILAALLISATLMCPLPTGFLIRISGSSSFRDLSGYPRVSCRPTTISIKNQFFLLVSVGNGHILGTAPVGKRHIDVR